MATGKSKQNKPLTFKDVPKLTDMAVQHVLKELNNDELAVSLKKAPKTIIHAFFKNMSKRAGEMIRDEMEFMGPVRLSDIEVAQRRVAEIMNDIAKAHWQHLRTPSAKAKPRATPQKKKYTKFDWRKAPVSELIECLVDLAALARRDGVLALENHANQLGDFIGMGLHLAIDGTDPEIINHILNRRTQRLQEDLQLRLDIARVGLRCLNACDNPRIVQLKLIAELPVETSVDEETEEQPPKRIPFEEWSTGQLITVLLNLSEVSRRDGILALQPLVKSYSQLLRGAFGEMFDGTPEDLWLAAFDTQCQKLLTEHATRLKIIRRGIMAVQAGYRPMFVKKLCDGIAGIVSQN